MVLDYKPRGDEAPNLGNSGFDRIRTLRARGFKVYLKLSGCERYQGDCNQARVTVRERERGNIITMALAPQEVSTPGSSSYAFLLLLLLLVK